MKIEKIYLIAWIQRTTIHLQELHDLLRGNFDSLVLDRKKLEKHFKNLQISAVELKTHNDFDTLYAKAGDFEFTVVEDGVFSLSTDSKNPIKDQDKLETYYHKHLGPALAYLFSGGAPLPKE